MRLIKISVIICVVGVLLQIFAFINLKVSYKSEVDIMETHVEISKMSLKEKNKEFQRIEVLKQKILNQQFVAKLLFWVFLIGLIISSILLYKRI